MVVGRLAALVVWAAIGMIACSSQPSSGSQPHGGGIYSAGRLRLQADPRSVLVRIGGEPALTVQEFNDRLGEFPVGDEGQDVVAARKKVVSKMIDVKVIVREAARQRPPEKVAGDRGPPYDAERKLAFGLIRTSVANPLLVSDGEARKYYEEHRDSFQQMDASPASEEERMLAIKLTLLNERWQEKIRTWRSQQPIEISEDLLED
jgi:hypothetical protein